MNGNEGKWAFKGGLCILLVVLMMTSGCGKDKADTDIPPTAATAVARRIDGIYFNGRFLHATVFGLTESSGATITASTP